LLHHSTDWQRVYLTETGNRSIVARMETVESLLSEDEVAAARQRRLDAMHLQEIEGNPLTAEDVAMFEMFERERWSHERCIAFILDQARHMIDAKATNP
jgi:hypothetical protein